MGAVGAGREALEATTKKAGAATRQASRHWLAPESSLIGKGPESRGGAGGR